MLKLLWDSDAWSEYLEWLDKDRKTLKKINKLLNDMCRDPFHGIGKPEPLKEGLSGFWSRRITDEHRIVYAVDNDKIHIISCKSHYDDTNDRLTRKHDEIM